MRSTFRRRFNVRLESLTYKVVEKNLFRSARKIVIFGHFRRAEIVGTTRFMANNFPQGGWPKIGTRKCSLNERILRVMTTTEATPLNPRKTTREYVSKTLDSLLTDAMKHGFHGLIALEVSILDGKIQHLRRKIEQFEK